MSNDPAVVEKYIREHPELVEKGPGGVPTDMEQLSSALTTGLGSAKTVSFTVAGKTNEGTGQAPLLLDLQLADAAAAKKLQADLADLGKLSETTCEQHDDHVALRAKGFAAGTGKLADSPLFKEAMAGGVAKPSSAVYLDGKQVVSDDGPVKAIGVTAGKDGADTVFLARIVIK
jgi:hypothetical protein